MLLDFFFRMILIFFHQYQWGLNTFLAQIIFKTNLSFNLWIIKKLSTMEYSHIISSSYFTSMYKFDPHHIPQNSFCDLIYLNSTTILIITKAENSNKHLHSGLKFKIFSDISDISFMWWIIANINSSKNLWKHHGMKKKHWNKKFFDLNPNTATHFFWPCTDQKTEHSENIL